jgi:hypothetical protein
VLPLQNHSPLATRHSLSFSALTQKFTDGITHLYPKVVTLSC